MQNWRHNDIQHVKSEAFPYFTVIFHSVACNFMYVLRHLKNGDGDGTVLALFAQRPHRRLLRMRLRHFLVVHTWRIATTFSAGILYTVPWIVSHRGRRSLDMLCSLLVYWRCVSSSQFTCYFQSGFVDILPRQERNGLDRSIGKSLGGKAELVLQKRSWLDYNAP